MKNKTKKGLSSARVILRIMKDSLSIGHWLILATILSIGSAFLAMKAPEILGDLTNQIYALIDSGASLNHSLFIEKILTLTLVYLLSAALGASTTAVMNYSVSSFFTCKIRVKMSEKIAKIPVKTVDSTPNGEIISRMTNDVSVMGGSVHDIFGVVINGVIKLVMISVIIFTARSVCIPAVLSALTVNARGSKIISFLSIP